MYKIFKDSNLREKKVCFCRTKRGYSTKLCIVMTFGDRSNSYHDNMEKNKNNCIKIGRFKSERLF